MKRILSILLTITTALLIAYFTNSQSNLATPKTILQQGRAFLNNLAHRTQPLAASIPFPLASRLASSTTTTTNMTTPRAIKASFLAREQSEGTGARVRRSIGTPQLRNFTPFLMLDHFSGGPDAGFPDHPHRGQETITYLLKGGVDHEDFAGNKGTLGAGDLQFMTAGRGIMHAEMPTKSEELTVGMQLWVDLPENLKSCEPRYRDLRAAEIPQVTAEDGKVTVKVISGRSLGVDSVKDLAYTPVWYLDVTIRPGGTLTQELPKGWNAFAYTLQGVATFGDGPTSKTVTPYHNVVFEQEGDVVSAHVEEGATEVSRFILVAGQPLDQPIVQYGPFVTTSKEAVYQAMMDFQTSSNGFERAANWESEIGKTIGRVR
jgi:redox-sensitive bicupin YhaK (pirin superfamily)